MLDQILGNPLGNLIRWCYSLCGNYVWAIILFTLFTKVILFPVTLWTSRNSLKMVALMPELNRLKIKYYGDKDTVAGETQAVYKRERYHPLASTVPMLVQLALLIGVIGAVRELLEGAESILSVYPAQTGGITLLIPLAAGAAALVLGLAQNHLNPLQREQGKAGQWMTNGLSIGISLALGAFVPVGVGIYWIASNLLTIAQQIVLNAVMPPKKYVDYGELEKSRRELAAMDSLSANATKEDKLREKEDYKRFFSIANKHLVFYSEKSGFYKYFQDVIEYLLSHSNINIHYITSDPKDQIFTIAKSQPHIKPYYIGERRLITLFMKMDADIVVMTTPDLDNLYLKRSYVKKDIEYIFMPHGIGSHNLLFRKGALSHYDTIFCPGEELVKEFREEERVYNLAARNLILCGYGLLERTISDYENKSQKHCDKPQILIAPSWQADNILDSCIDAILESLLCGKYRIVIRPHPEYCKRYPQKIRNLEARYHTRFSGNFLLQTDFTSNNTVFESDVIITDWSTICYEFSFTTKKPTLFVNTPMKVMNPDYQRLNVVPMDIAIRNEIGESIELKNIGQIEATIRAMLAHQGEYQTKIEKTMQKCLFYRNESGKIGGKYILQRLIQYQQEKNGTLL